MTPKNEGSVSSGGTLCLSLAALLFQKFGKYLRGCGVSGSGRRREDGSHRADLHNSNSTFGKFLSREEFSQEWNGSTSAKLIWSPGE
jgi:hypothetical protein